MRNFNAPLTIVPFVAGRRPIDEARSPGQGCSEHVGYIGGAPLAEDELWLLFRLPGAPAAGGAAAAELSVRLSAQLCPEDDEDDAAPQPIAQLTDVEVPPRIPVTPDHRTALLQPAAFAAPPRAAFVAVLPLQQLVSAVGEAAFTLAHQYHRRLRVTLTLCRTGHPLGADSIEVEIYDLGRMGELYRRLRERLLAADTARQAGTSNAPLRVHHHPFFPVLAIGSEKARLYTEALKQDLRGQQRHLPDARWLLRVGLYLELLTCLGICEAVGPEHPELLSTEERRMLAASPAFAKLRARLNVDGWRQLWSQREIAVSRTRLLTRGGVSLRNLRRKQQATLAFLHAHHRDLRAALVLAGPSHDSAQQSWIRVFRDAERAVFRQYEQAFPELQALPQLLRRFVLWHRKGELPLLGRRPLTAWLAAQLGDEDGLFAAAAAQYRQSMNEVAAWAQQRGLMSYTGVECVPLSASLFHAQLTGQRRRFRQLQHRDGYPSSDLGAALLAQADAAPEPAPARALAGLHQSPRRPTERRRPPAVVAHPLASGA